MPISKHPVERAAQPEKIDRLAVFLASSGADYVTGASCVRDGVLMIIWQGG
jgi:glucose 1-dehydrogenase